MISFVSGVVRAAGATSVVVEAGGIGFELNCTPQAAAGVRIGESVTLPAMLVVREDSMTLFGFSTAAEREEFAMVQNASGVGPKLAMAIVSVLGPAELKSAVLAGDLPALCRVPGIGQKGAQKLVIELKDRVLALDAGESSPAPSSTDGSWRGQVREGLIGLGYSSKEADRAADSIEDLATTTPTPPIGALMRAALASLAKH